MAYQNNSSNGSNGNKAQGSYAGRAPAAAAGGGKVAYDKPFEKDPNEVGFAYEKSSDKGGTYLTVTITADIPTGAKIMIFQNKTKNRTEKTPTHVLKLANMQKN